MFTDDVFHSVLPLLFALNPFQGHDEEDEAGEDMDKRWLDEVGSPIDIVTLALGCWPISDRRFRSRGKKSTKNNPCRSSNST